MKTFAALFMTMFIAAPAFAGTLKDFFDDGADLSKVKVGQICTQELTVTGFPLNCDCPSGGLYDQEIGLCAGVMVEGFVKMEKNREGEILGYSITANNIVYKIVFPADLEDLFFGKGFRARKVQIFGSVSGPITDDSLNTYTLLHYEDFVFVNK